jgi:ABC-type antimicrobial peptide transport system permease subunit
VHPAAVVDAFRPMRTVVDRQLAPWRFAALLLSLLAALGVVVAVVGLYALLSRQVADRTREIGIRIALGARHRQIVQFFAVLTGRVMAAGLLAGLVSAVVASEA